MTKECQIHKTHNPSVATTVRLGPLPIFMLTRLADAEIEVPKSWGRKIVWICPTGKANIEAYAQYLLGEGKPLPVRVGTETKVLAQLAVSRYLSALGDG